MKLLEKLSYEEVCNKSGRNEIIVLDTNVWLELFYFSIKDIRTIVEALNKACFVHELYVTPHIFEEYINCIKKLKNTFDVNFEQKKKQVLQVYYKMKTSINSFNKSFNNYVGFGEIKQLSNNFYDFMCEKIDNMFFDDLSSFDAKKELIDNLMFRCQENYSNIKKRRFPITFGENIWQTDRNKGNNSDGDQIIWNEILEIVVNSNANRLIFVTEEKKNEWNSDKLIESLSQNTSMELQVIDNKSFICNNLSAIPYDLFCKCVNNYDRYYQYINIADYNDLCIKYNLLMKNFKPMIDDRIDILIKTFVEPEINEFKSFRKIDYDKCVVKYREPLEKSTIETCLYDEIKLVHSIRQKVDCTIIIVIDDTPISINLKDSFIKYYLVSDRVLSIDELSTESVNSVEEWISEDFEYDYSYLRKKIKILLDL